MDAGDKYLVSIAQSMLDKLNELFDRAIASRRSERFVELLREMEFNLTHRPLEWGDPPIALQVP